MKYTSKSWQGHTYTIDIDLSKDDLLPEFSKKTLKDRYLLDTEDSPQQAFARAAIAYSDSEEMAQRIYNYASDLWFMFATPVLANGGTERGLPISCYLNYVEDSRQGLLEHYNENAWLSSLGGGIGGYWGDVRANGSSISKGGTSTGVVPFMCVVDKLMLSFSQGSTRRGSYAAYLPISHPEVEEFIHMRDATGDRHRRVNRSSFNLAVIVPDEFMEAVKTDGYWDLIDPNSKRVFKTVKAKDLWREILARRHETGEPYIMFENNVNNGHRPVIYKALDFKIKQSNLCSEITLLTGLDQHGKDRTAVCCLSSLNLESYHKWKGCDRFIYDMVRYLDNTLQGFIDEAPEHLAKAKYAAIRERSLGLGTMGWHSFLQQNDIAFESALALSWNKRIFEQIHTQALRASEQLACEKGACPDGIEAGVNVRNANVIAIAPNASSSIMCGNTSPGIEPYASNSFKQVTLSGTSFFRNKYLDKLLDEKYSEFDKEEVWADINRNDGSVQQFDWMKQEDKDVFKTAFELDQYWVVQQAADRTPFICQSQSLNLFFPATVSGKYLEGVHNKAWELGVKTLYYVRSREPVKAEGTSVVPVSDKLQDYSSEECLGCAN